MPPLQLFYYISTAAIFALAWWKGGAPERLGVIVLVVAYFATGVVKDLEWHDMRIGVAAVDVVLAAVLIGLAMTHQRWWLLLAASNQSLVVLAHFAAVSDPTLGLRVSVASRWAFGLIALYALLGGVVERWLAGERVSGMTRGEQGSMR